MKHKTEVWWDIPGVKNYQLSNRNRVKSLKRRVLKISHLGNKYFCPIRERILKQKWTIAGYKYVTLNGKNYFIHQLVLLVHEGFCPPGMECSHKNDIKTDNRWPENLEYTTHQKNCKIRELNGNGNHPKGEKHFCAKLTETDVCEFRKLFKRGWPQIKLANRFGISSGSVQAILVRRSWKHI